MTTSITATKSSKLTTKPCTPRRKTAMMSTITATKSTKLTTIPFTTRCQTGNNDKALCTSTRHAGQVAQWQQRYGLVRKRKTCRLCHTRATTTRPCVQAHDMLVASHNGNNNKASSASARHVGHVTQWQQRYGLVCKRTTCRLCCTMAMTTRPCAQAHDMPVVSHNSNNNKALCASAQHAGCIARWRRQQQQQRQRQQSQRVPPYIARKRTSLSAIVRKRTGYSVKHRCNNQLETSNVED